MRVRGANRLVDSASTVTAKFISRTASQRFSGSSVDTWMPALVNGLCARVYSEATKRRVVARRWWRHLVVHP